jgi:hypothetical protein
MNEWKCTVKTPSNWLQTVRVEAYTHSDAVAFAESQTGGKCITAVIDNSYNNSASESNDGAEVNGGLILFGLAVLLLVYVWKWILLIGAISLLIWLIIKYSQE